MDKKYQQQYELLIITSSESFAFYFHENKLPKNIVKRFKANSGNQWINFVCIDNGEVSFYNDDIQMLRIRKVN